MKTHQTDFPVLPGLAHTFGLLLGKARQGSSVLYTSGLVSAGLFVLFSVASLLNNRLVDGNNAWLKPQKFAIAIAWFTMTYAIFLYYLPATVWKKIVSYGICLCMAVELSLIGLQAGRGVASHFNTSTPFDATVFSVMGMAIVVNVLLLILIFIRYCQPVQGLHPTMLLAIRLGMTVFLFGNLVGGYMVRIHSHGTGLADFRLVHFMGMHAIQIIPTFAWLTLQPGDRSQRKTWLFATVYGGLLVAIFLWMVYG